LPLDLVDSAAHVRPMVGRANTLRALAWLRRNGLISATALAAALPVIVSTIQAVSAGWLPLGDRAVIAIRAFDVLSTHPPLVGQYSAASQVIGEPVLSPGPLLYWLLALPVRLGGPAPVIAIGLINTCSIAGVVVLARRRGGLPFMFATAAAVAVMCSSLEGWILHDIWNPSAALFPFLLLIFLAWSVACGEWRLLPLGALVASFVVQAQLTYVAPTALLIVVSVGFLYAMRPTIPRRFLLVTLGVVAVCWSFPLVEEVVHRPGNVERIVEVASSAKPTFGAGAGVHSVVHAIGLPPWWLQGPRDSFERVSEVAYAPRISAFLTAGVVLIGLTAIVVFGLRRGRRDLAVAALLALSLMLALGAGTASTPTGGILFGVVGYTLWWASPAGMFCWLVLGYGVAVGSRLGDRLSTLHRPPAARATLAGVVGVALIGTVVASSLSADPFASSFTRIHRLVNAARDAAPTGETVVIDGSRTALASEIKGAVAYGLRDRGVRFLSADPPGIGTRYDPALHPHRGGLNVLVGAETLTPPGRVVAREVLPPDAPGTRRTPRTGRAAEPVVISISP
jgi:hypothetical protein